MGLAGILRVCLCVYKYLGIKVPIGSDPGSQKSRGSINEHYDFEYLFSAFLRLFLLLAEYPRRRARRSP
jgi:hypothetical protein